MKTSFHHTGSDSLNVENIPFFFVIGSPRSGTTLLQQMLDANPNLLVPIESRWVVTLYKQFANKKNWNEKSLMLFLDELYKDDAFRDFWNIERSSLEKKITALDKDQIDYPFLVKLIYLNYPSPFEKNQIQYIGDKNPPYSIYIDILLELFPTAKFIHIVRDYRPNIASNRKWFIRKDVASLACKWIAFNQQVEKHKKKNPSQFFTLQYEKLANEPETNLMEVCSFLGVNYHPNMLTYHEKSKSYKVEGRKLDLKQDLEGIHQKLASPVTNKDLNSWKTQLTKNEIELADYIASNFAARYGYHRIYNKSRLRFSLKKLKGKISVFLEVFIKRFYHKYINIKTRRVIRIISHHTFKLLGMKNIFHPVGLKRS